MEIKTHAHEITKTVRYSTYGILSAKTKYCWMALHGSRMLCEQILYKFSDFDPEEHFVVAPEAFNRLYAKDFGGDVVATWMTKRDRLNEIKDIVNYLSSIYDLFSSELPAECRKILFGFSQGGTMAFRWLNEVETNFNTFLAYSCWIPEEIDLTQAKTKWTDLELIYTYGKQDEYLTAKAIEKLKAVVDKNQLPIINESYEGDHRIDRENLQRLFNKYVLMDDEEQKMKA